MAKPLSDRSKAIRGMLARHPLMKPAEIAELVNQAMPTLGVTALHVSQQKGKEQGPFIGFGPIQPEKEEPTKLLPAPKRMDEAEALVVVGNSLPKGETMALATNVPTLLEKLTKAHAAADMIRAAAAFAKLCGGVSEALTLLEALAEVSD